jgi:hypothetical protein
VIRQVRRAALTVLVSTMPVYCHITTEGILRFCSAESASKHVQLMASSYRDLLAEEKLPLVANHPKGSQKLLPSIAPVLRPGSC